MDLENSEKVLKFYFKKGLSIFTPSLVCKCRAQNDLFLNLFPASSVSSDQPDRQSRLWHQLGNADLGAERPRRLLHSYGGRYPRPCCVLFIQQNNLLSEAGVRSPVHSHCGCFQCDVQQQHRSSLNI